MLNEVDKPSWNEWKVKDLSTNKKLNKEPNTELRNKKYNILN